MLNIYMGYSKDAGSAEAACLIFAPTAKFAKKLARPIVESWFGGDFFDVRVDRLWDAEHLRGQMKCDEPHAIESPDTCPRCEIWGHEPMEDGQRCENCYDWD